MNLRLDDLQIKNYYIYQDTDSFCFGVDAVLLANFMAKFIKRNDKLIDLCSGSGIIPILIYAKRENKDITMVEVNKDMCSVAEKSLEYNKIDTINIINNDLNQLDKSLYNKFDSLSVNPPYYKTNSGIISENDNKKIARHEILCNFDDIAKVSSKLLKDKGKFFLVHRTDRFEEILLTLNKYRLTVKDVKFIYPKKNKNSNLFLLKAVKNAKQSMNILPSLIMYQDNDQYTKEFMEYYYEDRTSKQ
ncbi:methyltransferase [Anaerofustis stercorihominis]|uniref:Methyltransferase small domain protein n=1 Tax=Anaerofustis stercorihominis DSM 17244 TaxID=445971 RepID=B1C9Y0_9FIRM|nr:methyltransferase [Anaerofustis stercorihominis]EDS72196.1 methyltransferase small domain protein [Anaerofustis stercorihominis DSM 17244]MCQ4795758.1 methyltransferase [Anaerofustis stercorihominis]